MLRGLCTGEKPEKDKLPRLIVRPRLGSYIRLQRGRFECDGFTCAFYVLRTLGSLYNLNTTIPLQDGIGSVNFAA